MTRSRMFDRALLADHTLPDQEASVTAAVADLHDAKARRRRAIKIRPREFSGRDGPASGAFDLAEHRALHVGDAVGDSSTGIISAPDRDRNRRAGRPT